MNESLVIVKVIRKGNQKEVTQMANVNAIDAETKGTAKEVEELHRAPTVVPKEGLGGRWAVLSVLARAADEPEFLARMEDNPHEALKEYYTLSPEEKAALASGDIQKIESWVGKLDKRLATWLWCRLSQEKW